MMNVLYPASKNIRNHYLMAAALAFWIFIFLFFAEPFKIDRFTTAKKLWTLPIYGIIQGICYSIPLWYQQRILKRKDSWMLKNEILFLVFVCLLAIVFNYIFYRFFVTAHVNTYSFFDQVRVQVLPSIAFVLPILILTRYVLGKLSEPKTNVSVKIQLTGKGQNDVLSLNENDLLFIKSSDNYVEVNYLESNNLVRKILRTQLSEIEKQYPQFLRTHRSYLVNKSRFIRFEYQNQKLFLILDHGLEIPVSRGKAQLVRGVLSK